MIRGEDEIRGEDVILGPDVIRHRSRLENVLGRFLGPVERSRKFLDLVVCAEVVCLDPGMVSITTNSGYYFTHDVADLGQKVFLM